MTTRLLTVIFGCLLPVLGASAAMDLAQHGGRYHGYYGQMGPPMMERAAPRQFGGKFVCYDTRHIMRDRNGDSRVRYDGCQRSWRPCESMGMNHFGRYDNQRAANRAMYRCRTGTPRFVD